MRKYSFFIIILALCLLFSQSCKKEQPYPNDIPDWLKETIDNCIKKDKQNGTGSCMCGTEGKIGISEVTYKTQTYYRFGGWKNPLFVKWYNYEGFLMTTCNSYQNWDTTTMCNKLEFKSTRVREIWVEEW